MNNELPSSQDKYKLTPLEFLSLVFGYSLLLGASLIYDILDHCGINLPDPPHQPH